MVLFGWSRDELVRLGTEAVELGDARRRTRLIRLLEVLSACPAANMILPPYPVDISLLMEAGGVQMKTSEQGSRRSISSRWSSRAEPCSGSCPVPRFPVVAKQLGICESLLQGLDDAYGKRSRQWIGFVTELGLVRGASTRACPSGPRRQAWKRSTQASSFAGTCAFFQTPAAYWLASAKVG